MKEEREGGSKGRITSTLIIISSAAIYIMVLDNSPQYRKLFSSTTSPPHTHTPIKTPFSVRDKDTA